MMGKCNICGTRTGQHGFSFDNTLNTPNSSVGILMIPEELLPDDMTDDEFISRFIEHMSHPLALVPEIKIIRKK